MTETQAEPLEAAWKPVAGVTTLRAQVDKRWPNRDKRSDGIVGDADHASRTSDHNPDGRGYVHALDLDEDLRGSKNDNIWLADQLIAYPRMKRAGSERLKYAVYENEIASGTYPLHFWTWRGDNFGHTAHMHVSFTTVGEKDGSEFNIPILYGTKDVWDGVAPWFDYVMDAAASGAKTKATWRLACRLSELGFYEGTPQPIGKQAYPIRAIKAMQDYMGWRRRAYDHKVHRAIFKELTLSPGERP